MNILDLLARCSVAQLCVVERSVPGLPRLSSPPRLRYSVGVSALCPHLTSLPSLRPAIQGSPT